MKKDNTLMVPKAMPQAPVLRTGQIDSISENYPDDGSLKKGVEWPDDRFTENGDGTVTDTLTGLIWLQQLNLNNSDHSFAAVDFQEGKVTWRDALIFANYLQDGDAELQDGSATQDWRLPNIRELSSLIDYGRFNPALPKNNYFDNKRHNVRSDQYWTSTTDWDNTQKAWVVNLLGGGAAPIKKTKLCYVWPVRNPR